MLAEHAKAKASPSRQRTRAKGTDTCAWRCGRSCASCARPCTPYATTRNSELGETGCSDVGAKHGGAADHRHGRLQADRRCASATESKQSADRSEQAAATSTRRRANHPTATEQSGERFPKGTLLSHQRAKHALEEPVGEVGQNLGEDIQDAGFE
jgi:hypothetical protein